MRTALIDLILAHCQSDPDAVFLTGDLGFSVVEPLQDFLGERFINAGVAEQNMMTMAAALADTGFKPYVYSIAPFVTARCFEQIRNDICYHEKQVFIIGTGAGLSYGSLGPSHHSLEDAAVLATLPGVQVLSPANKAELAQLHRLALSWPGPSYFRVSRESGKDFAVPRFPSLRQAAHAIADGADICLVANGPTVATALDARDRLAQHSISAQVVSVPVLSPFPAEAVAAVLPPNAPVLALFEGYSGGPLELGLRRLLMNARSPVAFADVAIDHVYPSAVGNTEFLRELLGIGVESVLAAAMRLLRQ